MMIDDDMTRREDGSADALVALIAPEGIAVAEAPVGDHEDALFPEETEFVARAVPSRRREFATGRLLARRALRALGGPDVALPPRADRTPAWPEGYIGSITHTASRAAAAVARASEWTGIGIDLERISRMSWSYAPRIATARERRWLEAAADRARALTLLFSAKEAWFKCQYPVTRRFLDFDEAEITPAEDGMSFRVESTKGTGALDPRGRAHGRFAWTDDCVAAIVTLPRR